MEIMIDATKKYSEKMKRFTFESYEEDIHVIFDGEMEPSEENDYDVSRTIQVDGAEFKKSIILIAQVPTLQTKIRIKRDSWNTYPDGHVTVKSEKGELVLEMDREEYVFVSEELVALLAAMG